MRPPALLTTTIGFGLLWLLTATSADAAPGPRRAHSCGGPPAACQRLSRLGLHLDPTPHVQRTKRTSHADDEAAIQNDAPAAGGGAYDQTIAALQPIGFLVGPVDSHARTRAFSPRSPRGPPRPDAADV
jgi:hypothetical protein